MKLLMIIGGLIGFLIGISMGWARQNDWSSMLWRAALAAYLCGLLFRWWGGIWLRSLREVGEQRLATARRERAEAEKNRNK